MTDRKNLTFSGYAKNEVYNDLSSSFENEDYTRLCYLSAELACTHNEIKHLLTFLISEYSNNHISSNILELDFLVDQINFINGFSGKNVCYNNSFQKALCELVIFIATLRKQTCKLLLPNVSFHDVEPLLQKFGHVCFDDINDVFVNKVSNELFKFLNIFYFFLRKNHLQYIRLIISYLLFAKQYSLDDIDYHEIHDITKSLRKDIIWYLWKVILIFVEKNVDDLSIKKYVFQALRLYTIMSSKKTKVPRINLLLYCIVVLYNRKVKERPINYKVLKYASEKIYIVYEETLHQLK